MAEPVRLVTSPTMVTHLCQPNNLGRSARTLCGVEIRREGLGRAGWLHHGHHEGEPVACLKCARKLGAEIEPINAHGDAPWPSHSTE